MYRMIIGDDEKIIQESLMKFIDWKALGFEVAALVEDGKDAIDLLKRTEIDVIFCDIMMQEVSGLDVAKYIHDNHLNCEIVLLSGYQDFEYARSAIAYGVSEYLLKPVNVSKIKAVFRELKKKLDDKKAEQMERKAERDRIREYQHGVLAKLIEQCRDGKQSSARSIEAFLSGFGVPPAVLTYSCNGLSIHIAGLIEDPAFVEEILKNVFLLLQEQYAYLDVFVQATEKEDLFDVLLLSKEPFTEQTFLQMKEELQKHVKDICKFDSMIYAKERNVEFRQYLLSSKNPSAQRAELPLGGQDGPDDFWAKHIFMILSLSSDFAQAEEAIKDSADALPSSPDALQKIMGRIDNLIREKYDTSAKVELRNQDCPEETLLRGLKQYYEIIHREDITTPNLSSLTQQYIIDHISETISLKDAANNCFLSPNYFCRIFKEQTGEKFSEFCIRIKMEYAAEMLVKTRKRIYEISESLGYKNIKYFFKLFKRMYHCTPTEYRNMKQRQDQSPAAQRNKQ